MIIITIMTRMILIPIIIIIIIIIIMMMIKVAIVTLKLAGMKMMRQVQQVLLQSIIVVKLFIYKVRQVL